MDLSAQYRRASFRGVAFHWVEGDDDLGRRVATHEYPLRDTPNSEDLGKKAGTFRMRGLAAGKDFLARAHELMEACQKPGPGALVHPLYGHLLVACKACQPRYSTKSKGVVEFSLEFVEEGENRYPAANDDYALIASNAAQASIEVFSDVFNDMVQISKPSWLSEEMRKDLLKALALMKTVARAVASPATAAAELLGQIAAAEIAAVNEIITEVTTSEIVIAAVDGLGSLAGAVNSLAPFNAALAIGSFGTAGVFGLALPDIVTSTASRLIQAGNRAAFTALVGRLSAAHGITAAMNLELSSRQQARGVRDSLVELMDRLQIEAADQGDDEGFEALRELNSQVMAGFKQKMAALNPTVSLPVPAAVLPPLVLAYELYGDIDKEADILARNPNVFHPGMAPGGEELEVLSA